MYYGVGLNFEIHKTYSNAKSPSYLGSRGTTDKFETTTFYQQAQSQFITSSFVLLISN